MVEKTVYLENAISQISAFAPNTFLERFQMLLALLMPVYCVVLHIIPQYIVFVYSTKLIVNRRFTSQPPGTSHKRRAGVNKRFARAADAPKPWIKRPVRFSITLFAPTLV